MRLLDVAEVAAIQARTVVVRDFVWVTAYDRVTGIASSSGIWNDLRTVTASVVDGRTGATVARDFYGVGAALEVSSIPLTSDLTIRSVSIALPQVDSVVQALVRGLDVRGAPIQLYRGYFNPTTRVLVAPAKARFVGYVDGAPINTPAEGGEGSVVLNCVSTTRELTRTSSQVRSNDSQQLRSPGDDFYKDTAVCGDWVVSWGQASAPKTSGPPSGDVSQGRVA